VARAPRPTLFEEFGGRIRACRVEQSMSQETLGLEAGLHPTYISSVERGHRNVSLKNIVTIAEVLDVDPGDLLVGLRSRRR
jgi:transcriptional regulator with XRE-family HTH domain